MRLRLILLAMLAGMLVVVHPTSPAKSVQNFFNGNELHRLCSVQDRDSTNLFEAYVMGVMVDMATQLSINDLQPYYCIPHFVEAQQAADIVGRNLEQHSEKRHYVAASLVLEFWPSFSVGQTSELP